MNIVTPRKNFGYGEWVVICKQCGKERIIRAHKYKNGEIRGTENVCQPCRGINLQKRVDVTCPRCGKTRSLGNSDSQQRLSDYCVHCVHKKGKPKNKEEGHSFETSRGYIMLGGMKNHPLANKARQVLEHWLVLYNNHPMGTDAVVWFKENGFTVHHKNGIRSDNRLENLELRAPGRHGRGWAIEDMREVLRKYDAR